MRLAIPVFDFRAVTGDSLFAGLGDMAIAVIGNEKQVCIFPLGR
jgi:hypothetical protein